MNHDQVITNYFAQKPNRFHRGAVEWKGANIICEGNTLYSYGHHFALALRLPNTESLFLKNGDGYSHSTGRHQFRVQRQRPKDPTISFSALHRALREAFPRESQLKDGYTETTNWETQYYHLRNPHEAIKLALERGHLELVDWTEDVRADNLHRTRSTPESAWGPWTIRRVYYSGFNYESDNDPWERPSEHGTITITRTELEPAAFQEASYHLLGAALFRIGTTRWLCTLDEGQYCVIELPETVNKVHEAIECLKPWDVRAAEAREERVLRQGEWFFIPINPASAADYWHLNGHRGSLEVFQRRGKFEALPDSRPTPSTGLRNRHATKWFSWHAPDGIRHQVVVCTDRVKHLHPTANRLTREHRTTDLGKGWWIALRSRELRSITVGGAGRPKFD